MHHRRVTEESVHPLLVDRDEANPENVAQEKNNEEAEPILHSFGNHGVETNEAVEAKLLENSRMEHGDGSGSRGVCGSGPRVEGEEGNESSKSDDEKTGDSFLC